MRLASDPSYDQFTQYFGGGVGAVLALTYYVLLAVAMWRVFSKAGYLGILAFIPIVNWFIQVKIAGFSAWWGLLVLIPIVNVVFTIIVAVRIGRGFGHGTDLIGPCGRQQTRKMGQGRVPVLRHGLRGSCGRQGRQGRRHSGRPQQP